MAHHKMPERRKGADINVVPLIDIVLVLLIIFMVITPLIVKQMDINIPEIDPSPDTTPPPPQPDDVQQVVVLMTKDFNTYIGKDLVARNELADRLTKIMQGRKYTDKVLFFDAEDETNYGEAVKVLDIARGSGVVKIGLITDRTNMTFPGSNPVPGLPGAPGAPGAPGIPAAPATPAKP